MSEPQKYKRIEIPSDLDETDRLQVAQKVIQRIVERTDDNTDVNGRRFQNYSESYSKSLDFKIAGKDRKDPNLRLSSDMLESIQVLSHGPGYVTVGYNEGTAENDKANWAEASDNGPSRKFLGISETDLDIIVGEVKADRPVTLSGLAKQESLTKSNITKSLINNLLKSYQIDVDEEENG